MLENKSKENSLQQQASMYGIMHWGSWWKHEGEDCVDWWGKEGHWEGNANVPGLLWLEFALGGSWSQGWKVSILWTMWTGMNMVWSFDSFLVHLKNYMIDEPSSVVLIVLGD